MKTLVYDTETTGLISNDVVNIKYQPRIIEIFALVLDENFVETNHFHFLFNPGELIEEKVTQITSITNDMLKDQPKFEDKFQWIGSLFESVDEIVAHNLAFDKRMIDLEMLRCGIRLKYPRKICTVETTEYLLGYRLSLTALHKHLFKEAFAGAHRAENDVRALAKCFIELRKRNIV